MADTIYETQDGRISLVAVCGPGKITRRSLQITMKIPDKNCNTNNHIPFITGLLTPDEVKDMINALIIEYITLKVEFIG